MSRILNVSFPVFLSSPVCILTRLARVCVHHVFSSVSLMYCLSSPICILIHLSYVSFYVLDSSSVRPIYVFFLVFLPYVNPCSTRVWNVFPLVFSLVFVVVWLTVVPCPYSLTSSCRISPVSLTYLLRICAQNVPLMLLLLIQI